MMSSASHSASHAPIWIAATRRRFPTARHVAQFQSADMSAHSKSGQCPSAQREFQVAKVAIVGVSVLSFADMLRWFEYSRVYRPTKEWEGTGAEISPRWEDVYFEATDGVRLNAWFFAAAKDSPRSRQVMLVCHGNGGNLSHRGELCRVLLRTGVNVFIFDYRGYGRSGGELGEEGTYLDAQGAHAWLRKRGFAGENIIALGESLGGGIAAELAVRETLGGLVLQSTFTSIPDVGAELYPWLPVRWLHTIKYDTLAKLPRIHVPVLITHSRSDGLIGYHHAERLFAAANEPKLRCETEGDHNDSLHSKLDRCFESMEKFLGMVDDARKSKVQSPRSKV